MNCRAHALPLRADFLRGGLLPPLAEIVDERTAAIYELGVGNLQLSPGGGTPNEELRRFEDGLIDLRRRTGLYANIRAR
jgi:hypothetical protein